MALKLWHKLALTFLGITAIVLILAVLLSRQSIKSGFLEYLNDIELQRLDRLSLRLSDNYAVSDNWDFMRGNHALWHRYLRLDSPAKRAILQQGRPLPRLNELGKREGDPAEGFNDKLPPQPPPPPPFGLGKPQRMPPPLGMPQPGNMPPSVRLPPHLLSLGLVNKDKSWIVGNKNISNNVIFKPIILDKSHIGYLTVEPFTEITDQLDQQFLQHQTSAFIKITFIALGIVLLGTWLLANYLRRRINSVGNQANQLMTGNYRHKEADRSTDELGILSSQLNHLGETLEQNLQSRQRWISDISHELRTPVAVLQGECEAMLDGIRDINQASIESLHQEVMRLNRLVKDLHELSLADMGALSYHKEQMDLVGLLKEMLAHHEHQFKKKNITVKFDSVKPEILIQGDAQRLEQLFSNLANNSLHYTGQSGRLEITVSENENSVVIEWSDSEPGVSDKELSLLFERLYRVESSRNRNAGGSGLGLAICKNIVEAHHGTIVAEHSPLGGISFIMTFSRSETTGRS